MAGNHFYKELDFGSGRYKFLIVSSQGRSLDPILNTLTGQGYPVIDAGHELSLSLSSLNNIKNISIEAEDCLRSILNQRSASQPDKPLFLHNLGILADPILKLDPENILRNFSRNHPLVILSRKYVSWSNIQGQNLAVAILQWVITA